MKIKRQEYQEQYNVTVDWLNDFAKSLEKKSYNLENIKNIGQIGKIPHRFATIEEKMTDIKARVGFSIIKQMHENNENIITASENKEHCPCGGHEPEVCACNVKTAAKKSEKKSPKKEHVDGMKLVLKYIKDLCKHEHTNLTPIMVISRCRQEDGLRFNELPIQMDKLIKFIEKNLNKYEENDSEIQVTYIPIDTALAPVDLNSQSEFWGHAFPSR